jgi:effector-binding domain-containing protein
VLRIGEFSSLTQVSVKTLRYYDELGLLRPIHVDPDSGYRHYTASQLPRLHRILALRDLGFPLEQVARALDDGISPEQLRGMLKLRMAEQQASLREEQERLIRLEARLRLIEREGIMTKDVVVKETAPQWIASVRETIENYPSVGKLYGELFGALGPNAGSAGPCLAIWHDPEFRERDVDAEAAVVLKQAIPARGRVKVYELPGATVASLIHHGAYNRLSEAYDALVKWLEPNGYRLAGPMREIYLHMSQPVRQDDESYVTEIQAPVAKA